MSNRSPRFLLRLQDRSSWLHLASVDESPDTCRARINADAGAASSERGAPFRNVGLDAELGVRADLRGDLGGANGVGCIEVAFDGHILLRVYRCRA